MFQLLKENVQMLGEPRNPLKGNIKEWSRAFSIAKLENERSEKKSLSELPKYIKES